MSEKIDVLTLPPSYTPYFVVNTSAASVPISFSASPSNKPFQNAQGFKTFKNGDNFQIISAGMIFPENFTLATSVNTESIIAAIMTVDLHDTAGIHLLSQLNLAFPMENFELGLGVFVDANTRVVSDFTIECGFFGKVGATYPLVSMQNVPSALNGTTQLVTIFLKVSHSIIMSV